MKQKIKEILKRIIESNGWEVEFELREPPKEFPFDLATNLPFVVSKKYDLNVKEIFEIIRVILDKEYKFYFSEYKYTLPGFINLNISYDFYIEELKKIFTELENYPKTEKKNERVLLEFVSSNPTGPLHIGHGRCAVIGDVLGNIMKKLGYEVLKEYYINDRGRQMNILLSSILDAIYEIDKQKISQDLIEWMQNFSNENKYKGKYIIEIAKNIMSQTKYQLSKNNIDELIRMSVEIIMDDIKKSLKEFNVLFDSYFYESSLYESSFVKEVLDDLRKKELVEEDKGAIWFKAKDLGDDKDRVIVRSNGEATYFLSDIAYHLNKSNRGYNWLINVWGTDHHGYVHRLKSAVESLIGNKIKINIILYQLVSLLKDGKRISMSTREGKFICLDEVLNEVGCDITRFFLITKSPNTHLDFDLNLAKEHSIKNPVYYIQYGFTRCCGILREAGKNEKEVKEGNFALNNENFSRLSKYEKDLIKKLCFFEDTLHSCVENFSPHFLCIYLLELSKMFHQFYENCKVIVEDREIFNIRLQLTLLTKIILSSGLSLLGVSSPEKM